LEFIRIHVRYFAGKESREDLEYIYIAYYNNLWNQIPCKGPNKYN